MAIKTGNSIRQLNPSDGDAEELLKRASVAAAMNKGKWEESEDYRAQLKDESEAQSLEQASKTVNDSKSLEELIRQTYQKVEEEPANLNYYRQLSDYYQRYGDLQNAIAWIQEARKQEGGQGDALSKKGKGSLPSNTMINRSMHGRKLVTTTLTPDAQASLEEARNHKKVYQKTQLESLVQRYPNDYANRFELGLLAFRGRLVR